MKLSEHDDNESDDDEEQRIVRPIVPPSTPVLHNPLRGIKYSFPPPQSISASAMRLDVSSNPYSSLLPPKPVVSFAEDVQPLHDRKRNRRSMEDDGAVEEIMSQITLKLTGLSTESMTPQQDSITAFLEVLGCNEKEAEFYLESSGWDIQTAVTLYLENNPHPFTFERHNNSLTGTFMTPFQTDFYTSAAKANDTKFQWRDRIVEIAGLDPIWEARVNPFDGCIFFRSKLTGISQKCVPPGFADVADELMQSSIRSSPACNESDADILRNGHMSGNRGRMDEEDSNSDEDGGMSSSTSHSISTNCTNAAHCGSVHSADQLHASPPIPAPPHPPRNNAMITQFPPPPSLYTSSQSVTSVFSMASSANSIDTTHSYSAPATISESASMTHNAPVASFASMNDTRFYQQGSLGDGSIDTMFNFGQDSVGIPTMLTFSSHKSHRQQSQFLQARDHRLHEAALTTDHSAANSNALSMDDDSSSPKNDRQFTAPSNDNIGSVDPSHFEYRTMNAKTQRDFISASRDDNPEEDDV